jgi:hypothetical protein
LVFISAGFSVGFSFFLASSFGFFLSDYSLSVSSCLPLLLLVNYNLGSDCGKIIDERLAALFGLKAGDKYSSSTGFASRLAFFFCPFFGDPALLPFRISYFSL